MQFVLSLATADAVGLTVALFTVADAVAVQPPAPVTVTEYVPVFSADKSSVIAPLLHK